MTPHEIAVIVPAVLIALVVGLILIRIFANGTNSDIGKTKNEYIGGSTRQYNKTW